jgi:hypothetical protein
MVRGALSDRVRLVLLLGLYLALLLPEQAQAAI